MFKSQNGGFKRVAAEMKNRDNIGENLGLFGVAVYEIKNFKRQIQNGGRQNEKPS